MEIELVNGTIALCDAADAELVQRHRWYEIRVHRRSYASTQIDGKRVYMHRLILSGVREVDHRNRDGLDNRRENLRACTHSQNLANADFPIGISGYRGVRANRKGWQARIGSRQNARCLGTYDTPEEAARVYDSVARETYGEFAYQNFPQS